MSRPLRIEFPGAWRHVMNGGRRRGRLYDDDADYPGFVALLREAAALWDIGTSFADIGSIFGLKSYSAVGAALESMRKRLTSARELSERCRHIQRILTTGQTET